MSERFSIMRAMTAIPELGSNVSLSGLPLAEAGKAIQLHHPELAHWAPQLVAETQWLYARDYADAANLTQQRSDTFLAWLAERLDRTPD